MSSVLDETAADVPVRDISVRGPGPHDPSVLHHDRVRQDVSRVSREELEDRFLRLSEETMHLKQHIHTQDDKIKKLGTKLMRLVKDRGRMEQLAAGGVQPASRVRDVEMEEMMEVLQEKVRALQADNEGLRQRLLVAKQQLVQSHRAAPFGHVQPRINSGLKRLRDGATSPSRPKSSRSWDRGARPPAGPLPRYGHSLLEEARAEVRNLENVVESQRHHMDELEAAAQQLREELNRKEAEHKEQVQEERQHQASRLRSHVSSNVVMIRLQKQLVERSNAVTELEGRFLQLQETQQTLKLAHDASMLKVDELSSQLKDERLKSLDLENQLQNANMSKIQTQQLQERISEVEQERDALKDSNERLLSRAFDVSQQQRWQVLEQQLRLQVSQLETALQADLLDKNQILDKIKAERDANEKLTEKNKKLQIQVLEQQQQLEELTGRLKFYSRDGDYDVAELTEALLLIRTQKAQRSGDLGFLKEVEEDAGGVSVRELRAAHAETIQELQKTRSLLSLESRISRDYKAELEAAVRRMEVDRAENQQRLERQAELLDSRAARIQRLEAQLRDVAYGSKSYSLKPAPPDEEDLGDPDERVLLQRGENLVELQVVGVSLSAAGLEALGDAEPSTFCTYCFYLFDLHATPVVSGRRPRYGFTSRYVVSTDDGLLDYLWGGRVTVELHQALGLDWKTLAAAQIRLRPLLEKDGKIHGSTELRGTGEDVRSFGSVDYWLRFRIPMTETLQLYREKMKAADYISNTLQPVGGSWNELLVSVESCSDLQSGSSRPPSPYVVYRFFHFPDYPTPTVPDSSAPRFSDCRSYSVRMDPDLQRYLDSEALQFYVFDERQEQMDTYVGKARVPLRPLGQDRPVSGVFPLSSPSGRPAGHIQVTLKWRVPYPPPPDTNMADEEPEVIPEEEGSQEEEGQQDEEEEEEEPQEKEEDEEKEEELHSSSTHPEAAAKVQLRHSLRQKDTAAAKRVTFREATGEQFQPDPSESPPPPPSPPTAAVPAPPEEEEDEEQSHVSEGQLVPAPPSSEDSDISEELEDVVGVPPPPDDDQTLSDSDDCIVHGQPTGRKPSERVRVEVVSLRLRAGSRVQRDVDVVRLFVEFSFLDLPTEETPLSLPKPPPGRSASYNYSKVFPVDVETNASRRRLLRDVLQGRNPQMERIRFTVVSEPPEEQEQDRECEDVGVASVKIRDILDRREDMMDTTLDVLDVGDSREVLGFLTVSVEGLDALTSIMEDEDVSPQAL